MRTTISLDDQLAKQVRREAKAHGMSMSAFIARTLNEAMKLRKPSATPPFRLVTVRGAKVRPGVDLNRPRALLELEDGTRFGRGRQES